MASLTSIYHVEKMFLNIYSCLRARTRLLSVFEFFFSSPFLFQYVERIRVFSSVSKAQC